MPSDALYPREHVMASAIGARLQSAADVRDVKSALRDLRKLVDVLEQEREPDEQ